MSKVYEVSDKDFVGLFKRIESQRPDAVKRGVASAILLGAELVARAAPKDLGTLGMSVHGEVKATGGGAVKADAPHAVDVELGSRPHWVPYKALLPWCIRHSNAEDGPRFARAVQQKIARDGTKPTFFMRKSLPTQRKVLKAEVERELHKG